MVIDDRVRVRHMIEATESALRFCEGMKEQDFRADERTQRAVLQCIEVIGEASRNITDNTRRQIPNVPWAKIVGMRHRLAHAYFDIDLALVWEVVAKELQPLRDGDNGQR